MRKAFALGYAIVGIVAAAAVLAPLIAPYSPIEANPERFLEPPSWDHWMGTDAVGMDIFSRVIFAPRVDLTIALTGTMISAVIGALSGALVGFYQTGRGFRSILGGLVMRAADVLQAFPVFVFAIALVASLGQSLQTVIIAIAFVNTPIYLRLMRSQVVAIRQMRFVEASVVAGLSDMQTVLRHIIPNAQGPVLAQLSVNIGWSILLTAGLSFIGAGVRAPTPEWGSMIAWASRTSSPVSGGRRCFPASRSPSPCSPSPSSAPASRRWPIRCGAGPCSVSATKWRVDGHRHAHSGLYRPAAAVPSPADRRHRPGQLLPGEDHSGRSGDADAGADCDARGDRQPRASSSASTSRCRCSS